MGEGNTEVNTVEHCLEATLGGVIGASEVDI